MFFDPASYFVPEGENEVLILIADKRFEVPFTIDVTLMNITAVGKCLVCIFPLSLYSIATVKVTHTFMDMQWEGGTNIPTYPEVCNVYVCWKRNG